MSSKTLAAACLALAALATAPARADDQTVLGAGNATATGIAAHSGLVQSALLRIRTQAETIGNDTLRRSVLDALFNPMTCVRHRAGLTAERKQAIVAQLVAEGLLADNPSFPGGLVAGVFPPVRDDGTACPHLPQPFYSASGGGQHHAYPGGIAVHEAFNLRMALSFAANYRAAAGYVAPDGLPRVGPIGETIDQLPRVTIDTDTIKAAPLWHDFGKTLVFQWNADGSQFRELGIAGTGGHHTLGLAETIARRLPPAFVVAQASAHQTPNPDSEQNVVGWLRAAAIIAGVDPVAYGVLTVASDGRLHLPPLRRLGEVDLIAGSETNLLVEDAINNLADADYVYAEPAVGQADVVLRVLGPRYGYAPGDARYTSLFRNAVLSNLGGEHIQITFANQGLAGVARDLDRLKAKGAF